MDVMGLRPRIAPRRMVLSLAASALVAATCKPFDEESAPALDGGLPPPGDASAVDVTDGGSGGLPTRVAFVTSSGEKAALGPTPSDWDERCNVRARSAGLAGTFVAWVSTPTSLALDRLGPEDRQWLDRKGAVVADDRAALTRGALRLVVDESGGLAPELENVWTGTVADGGASDDHCQEWTSDDAVEVALVGEVDAPKERWTASRLDACNQSNRLYCFQK